MILHKTELEDTVLYTLFDSKERVVIHPTRYLNYLRNQKRSDVSKKHIAEVVKQHCAWLEKRADFFGVTPDEMLSVVSSNEIVDWINYQRSNGISNNTINNREILVKEMYQYFTTKESSARKEIPWTIKCFTKKDHSRPPCYLDVEQIIKLLLGLYNESQRVAVHFAYDTGVRLSELVRFRVKDLPNVADFDESDSYYPIEVRGSKSYDSNEYKFRKTVISRAVLARIRRYHTTKKYRSSPYWKLNDPEKPIFLNTHGQALSKSSFYAAVKAAWLRQTGCLKGMSPHSLRHAMGYSILKSEFGNDIHDRLLALKEMYGHNNIESTGQYCSIPLVILSTIGKQKQTIFRIQEAERIYRETYIPEYKQK